MKKTLIFLISILIIVSSVHAFDFQVSGITAPSTKPYQGETATLTATLQASSSNVCHINCKWSTGQYEEIISTDIAPGQNKNFGFKKDALGSFGKASYTLAVTCEYVPSATCWYSSDVSHPYSTFFYFYYNGDNTCTISNENCATAISDCKCSSDRRCNPISNRGADSKGCATFCGNNKIENLWENCNSCPADVGKCEGQSCSSKNECEDNYCARGRCSKTPYLIGDGICDNNVGENCANSKNDCNCGPYENCISGACKTWCGNGRCESNEIGICKSDCDWCGDGECNSNENCQKCPSDCGVCETLPEEKITEVKQIIQEQKSKLTKTNIIIFGSVGGALVLLVIAWFVYKYLKEKPKTKKKKVSKKKEKTSKFACPKCKRKIGKKTQFCPSCGKKLR